MLKKITAGIFNKQVAYWIVFPLLFLILSTVLFFSSTFFSSPVSELIKEVQVDFKHPKPLEDLEEIPIEFIKASADSGTLFESSNGDLSINVAHGIHMKKNSYDMEMILQDVDFRELSDYENENNKLRLKNVYQNVDILYSMSDGFLKEDIILKEESAQNTFYYKINYSNLGVKQDNQGGISFIDKESQELVFYFYPPVGYDSDGKEIEYTLKLDSLNNLFVLKPAKNYDFSKFSYPIEIDPTVTWEFTTVSNYNTHGNQSVEVADDQVSLTDIGTDDYVDLDLTDNSKFVHQDSTKTEINAGQLILSDQADITSKPKPYAYWKMEQMTQTGVDRSMNINFEGNWDRDHVGAPYILKDEESGKYRMWYSGNRGGYWRILYTESSDGINWEQPVTSINIASEGSWDTADSFAPSIMIEDDGSYKIWYSAYNGSHWRIVYAESEDGIYWDNFYQSMNYNVEGGWDTRHAYHPNVMKENGIYKMWYTANNGTYSRILYAESTNGKDWQAPIRAMDRGQVPDSWDSYHAYSPSVIRDEGVYKMWYAAHNNSNVRIAFATSDDGINWNRPSKTMNFNQDGSWDDVHAHLPFVLKDGDRYHLWYAGYSGSNYRLIHREMHAHDEYQYTDGKMWSNLEPEVNLESMIGKSLWFNGYNDHFRLNRDIADVLEDRVTGYSVSTWIKADPGERGFIFSSRDYNNRDLFEVKIETNGEVIAQYRDYSVDTNVRSCTIPGDLRGSWHHISATVKDNTISCYLDGTFIDSGDLSGLGELASLYPPYVGNLPYQGDSRYSNGSWYYYGGLMDEMVFYQEELSSVEINELYQRGLNGEDVRNLYDAGQAYYTYSDTNQINTSDWKHFRRVIIDQEVPDSENIKFLVSFDNKSTWKYWDGSTWVTASLTQIGQFGNTEIQLESLQKAQWHSIGGFNPGVTSTFDVAIGITSPEGSTTPRLHRFTVNYGMEGYDVNKPYVTSLTGVDYTSLVSFSENLSADNLGTMQYQISNNGQNWYYWDGTGWVYTDGGFNNSNTAADVSANITAFGNKFSPGSLYIKVFLNTDDYTLKASLDSVSVEFVNDGNVAPQITSITPDHGPTSGGTEVKIEGSNFLGGTDGAYEREVTIPYAVGTTSKKYKVIFTLDTGSLIASGKMQSSCADIRFTDSDRITKLDYWIESGCDTAETRIHVMIPEISDTKQIYMSYGNPDIQSGEVFLGDTIYDHVVLLDSAVGTYTEYNIDIGYSSVPVEFTKFEGDTVFNENTSLGSDNTDTHMLMARVEGDLTIPEGVSINANSRKKGMVLYVEGDALIEGNINMDYRGANVRGQDLLIMREDGTEYIIPALGASGAPRISCANCDGQNGQWGTDGATGGGGSGGRGGHLYTAYSGAGGAGTSFSGGAGGGGVYTMDGYRSAGNGSSIGGAGGAGRTSSSTRDSGGGGGNPGGARSGGGATSGSTGTGGLLILIVEGDVEIDYTGGLTADGNRGGNGEVFGAGAGGAGGGSINLFYGGELKQNGEMQAGGGTRGYSQYNPGGYGGEGTARAVEINPNNIYIGEERQSLTVAFGGVQAESIEYMSDSVIKAYTPAHTVGSVDVDVTNTYGNSDTLVSGYTYETTPQPSVSDYNPTSGPTYGGTQVDFSGDNYYVSSYGDGYDGSVTVNSEINLNTDVLSSGRTCADAINFSVIGLTNNSATLSESIPVDCFESGDEILLINLKGHESSGVNVGNYEILTVDSIVADTIAFTTDKKNFYGDGSTDDVNIGTNLTNQRVMLQRVPNYQNLTVTDTGVLTVSGWDGIKGGVLFFKSRLGVNNQGVITVDALGYRGGDTYPASQYSVGGFQGESYRKSGINDNNTDKTYHNDGGGGATFGLGGYNTGLSNGGGGGGHATVGGDGTFSHPNHNLVGYGGHPYGDSNLNDLTFGSGGGAGGSGYNGSSWGRGDGVDDGKGGAGGGIIYISTDQLETDMGIISAKGEDGYNGWGHDGVSCLQSICGGPGGAGAGGSIKIEAESVNLGIDAVNGLGGASAKGSGGSYGSSWEVESESGVGGDGRIAIHADSVGGDSTPTAGIEILSENIETLVKFGTQNASRINTFSRNSLNAITPSTSVPGPVDVILENPGGSVLNISDGYTYYKVNSLVPSTGYIDETAKQLTINGDYIADGADVRLIRPGHTDVVGAGVSITNPDMNGSIVTAVFDLSTMSPGYWDLKVTNPGGDSFIVNKAFLINLASPQVIEVDPNIGPMKGGTEVTIHGSNFYSNILGTGIDGSVEVSGSVNLNTQSISGRTCADAVNYSVTSMDVASVIVSETITSDCIQEGDEILLINLQGDKSNYQNVGNYEFLRVEMIDESSGEVFFVDPISKTYGALSNNTDLTGQKIMIQRIPQYINVDILPGAKISASGWNGTKGGVVSFKATGYINNQGSISASGIGYRGGSRTTYDHGYQGEGYGGTGAYGNRSQNLGAGGAGRTYGVFTSGGDIGGPGGAGGYGLKGGDGSTRVGGYGGNPYGIENLNKVFLGGGGGGGAGDRVNPGAESGSTGGTGGRGGGAVLVYANSFNTSIGSVSANGARGANGYDHDPGWGGNKGEAGGGGGGAGGSVHILADTVNYGSNRVSVAGGAGSTVPHGYTGPTGGRGRIAVFYTGLISGSTSYSEYIAEAGTDKTIGAPLKVLFGGVAAHSIQLVDSSTIKVVTPSYPTTGFVDVLVSNPDLQQASITDGFVYMPDKYEFVNVPTEIFQDNPVELFVEGQDMNGNTMSIPIDVELTLDSSSPSGFFARDINEDPATRWDYNSFIIEAGNSRGSFFFKTSDKGATTITATPPVEHGSLHAEVTIDALSNLRLLVTGITDPIKAGLPSSVTVQAVDMQGRAVHDYTGTIEFSTDSPGGIVPSGQFTFTPEMLGGHTFTNAVSFVTQGIWCVTAQDINDPYVKGSQCNIDVTPPSAGIISQLKFITNEQTFSADGKSGVITVQTQDFEGTPIAVSGDTPIYIYSDSNTGEFSLDGTTGWQSGQPFQININDGTTTASFYYRDQTLGVHTLTAREDMGTGVNVGWENAEQPITVATGGAYKLVVTPNESAQDAGVWSNTFNIEIQDSLGNAVIAENDTPVYLTSDSMLGVFSQTGQDIDSATNLVVTINQGTSNASFYYKTTSAGDYTITVSDTSPANGTDGLLDDYVNLTVQPTQVTKFVITSPPFELVAGEASPMIVVEAQDDFGNASPVQSNTEVYLFSSESGAEFSADSSFTSPVTSFTLPTGSDRLEFYFRQMEYVSTQMITISDNSVPDGISGIDDDSQVENILPGVVSQLALEPSTLTGTVGQEIGPLTVTLLNQNGVEIDASSDININLFTDSISGSAEFSISTGASWSPISSILIAAGTSRSNFYYKDTVTGSYTLTAADESLLGTDTGLTNATSELSIVSDSPSQLGFYSSAYTGIAGEPIGAINIGLYDTFGNPAMSSTDTVISLTDDAGGIFDLTAEGIFDGSLNSITLPANTLQVSIYYKNISASNPTIFIDDQSTVFSSASQQQIINWGDVSYIELDSISSNAIAGEVSSAINIKTFNEYGINVPVNSDVVYNLSSDSAGNNAFDITPTGLFDGSITTVTQGINSKFARFYYRDEKAGTANITVAEGVVEDKVYTLEILAAPASQLVFLSAPYNLYVGEKSGTIKVELQDEYGNTQNVDSDTTFYLNSTSSDYIFMDENTTEISQTTMPGGSSSVEFFYKDFAVNTPTVTLSDLIFPDDPDQELTNAVQSFNVETGSVKKFRLSTSNTILQAGVASEEVLLETLNAFDQVIPTPSEISVKLSSTTGTGKFDIDPNGTFNLNTVTVPANASSTTFYFKETTAGDVIVTAGFDNERLIAVVNNSTEDLFNHQVKLHVNTQELISQGLMNEDGSDLRFTTMHNGINIDYWIESGLNTTDTIIWVNLPELSQNSTEYFYMSYGVETIPVSNKDSVFDLSDSYPDFTGWSATSTYSCGSRGMLGRFGSGAQVYKTLNDMPKATYQISFDFYHIDSWDNESGRFYINDQLLWSRSHRYSGYNVCASGYADSSGVTRGRTTLTYDHTGGDMTLKFNSTLNATLSNESWGVNNIEIIKYDPGVEEGFEIKEEGDLQFTVESASAYKMNILSASQEIKAGHSSSAIVVNFSDLFGNPTSIVNDTQIGLITSDVANGEFAMSESGPWGITSIPLTAGTEQFTFYYRNTRKGSNTISITDQIGMLEGDSQNINILGDDPVGIEFDTAQRTVIAQNISEVIRVVFVDQYGNRTQTYSNKTFNLNSISSQKEFSLSNSTWSPVDSISIAAGVESIEFYYKDWEVGSKQIEISDQSSVIPTASQNIDVIAGDASALSFLTDPQTIVINTPSQVMQVGVVDEFGNPTFVDADTLITLTSSGPGGLFSSDLNTWASTIDLTLSPGQEYVEFYYKDPNAATVDLEASSVDLDSVFQQEIIVNGSVDKIEIISSGDITAGEPGMVTIRTLTSTGLPAAVQQDTDIDISSLTGGEFSMLESPWVTENVFTIPQGFYSVDIYYKNNTAGIDTLTADESIGAGWTSGEVDIEVLPGDLYAFNITSPIGLVNVNEPSGLLTVEAQDMFGNAVILDAPVDVYLYSNLGGVFSLDPAGPWDVTSISIPTGSSNAGFYYQNAMPGLDSITVSDSNPVEDPDINILDADYQIEVVGDEPYSIEILTSEQTITAGSLSSVITLQLLDNEGNPAIVGEDTVIDLSSFPNSTGEFRLESSIGADIVTTATVNIGSSTVDVYYRNEIADVYTMVFESGTLLSNTQNITIEPGVAYKLSFTTPQQGILAGEESGVLRVALQDEFGNEVVADSAIDITLGSDSTSGEFSLDTGINWISVSAVSIPAGSSDVYFYYKDSSTGTFSLNAADLSGGYESATQNITVSPGNVYQFNIVSGDTNLLAGEPSGLLLIQFLDEFGNTTTFGADTTIYLYSDSSTGKFSTNNLFEQEIVSLDVRAGEYDIAMYYKDTEAGSSQITVSDQSVLDLPDIGIVNDTQEFVIEWGDITDLQIQGDASLIGVDQEKAFSVVATNRYSVPIDTLSDMSVYLSDSLSGLFGLNSGFTDTQAIAEVVIPAGQNSADFYYRTQQSGSHILTASDVSSPAEDPDVGLSNATFTQVVTSGDLARISIISSPQSLEAGQASDPIYVQTQDIYGNEVIINSALQLYLYSDSATGTFTNSLGEAITSIDLNVGESVGEIFYSDTSVGTFSIIISDSNPLDDPDQGVINATQNIVINSGNVAQLAFDEASLQAFTAGAVSSGIEINSLNSYGVIASVLADTTIFLSSDSLDGSFALSPTGPWGVTEVVMSANTSSVIVYYKDTDAGIKTLRASDTMELSPDEYWTDAVSNIEVTQGTPTSIDIITAEQSVIARHPSDRYDVQIKNELGAPFRVTSDTRVYLRSSSVTGEFSETSIGGWGLSYITIPVGSSTGSFYYHDSSEGVHEITASDNLPPDPDVDLINDTQNVTVLRQVFDNFLVTNITDPQQAGNPSSVVVMARDSEGYIIDWYDGTIDFSSGLMGSTVEDPTVVLPDSYTFNPIVDRGIKTFGNGVAFLSEGEYWVKVTDVSEAKTGVQNDITVEPNTAGPISRLEFVSIPDPYTLSNGQVSDVITIQAFDSNNLLSLAPAGGFDVHLTSDGDILFTTDPNDPDSWVADGVFTIPAGLSYLNIYIKNNSNGINNIYVSDWVGGVDDPSIGNDSNVIWTKGLDIVVNSSFEVFDNPRVWVTNEQIFARNNSGTHRARADFQISLFDQETGNPVTGDIFLTWKDPWGNVVSTQSVSDSQTFTYTINPIDGSSVMTGDYTLEVSATDLTTGVTNSTISSIPLSGWTIEVDYNPDDRVIGIPLGFTVETRLNGELADPPNFIVNFKDDNGDDVVGANYRKLMSDMVKNDVGMYSGTIDTSGLLPDVAYYLFARIFDSSDVVLAEDNHFDIYFDNSPLLAPPNFTIEKVVTSTAPNDETYDLRFTWDEVVAATRYTLYRSQDRFAKLYADPCTIQEVRDQKRLGDAVPDSAATCELTIEQDVTTNPAEDDTKWYQMATIAAPANEVIIPWSQIQNDLPNTVYYYILRAENGPSNPVDKNESGFSTMAFSVKKQLVQNSDKTSINWISLPFEHQYSKVSDIVQEIEGSLGENTNTKLSYVSLWNPLDQYVSRYRYRETEIIDPGFGTPIVLPGGWTGDDFSLLPGDGIAIVLENASSSFEWTIVGNDLKNPKNLIRNADKSSINWMSMPYSSKYRKVSDIVKDIEGGIGEGFNTKIDYISLWVPGEQYVTRYRYEDAQIIDPGFGSPIIIPGGWKGEDFDINAADGVSIILVNEGASFDWEPVLIVNPYEL